MKNNWHYGLPNPKFKELSNQKINDYLFQLKDLENEFNKLGYDIYLYGGNLLGALREKDLIMEDNDFDIGWLAFSNNRKDVKDEIIEVNSIFRLKGLKCREGQLLGQSHLFSNKKDRHFDTWASWIENNKFYFCFTIYGEFNKDVLLPFRKVNIRGFEFNIPNKSEEILTFLYGNWKILSDTKPKIDNLKSFFNEERL